MCSNSCNYTNNSMEITWINCADAHLPYEKIIVREVQTNALQITHGESFLLNIRESRVMRKSHFEWTPCTDEKWKELNK